MRTNVTCSVRFLKNGKDRNSAYCAERMPCYAAISISCQQLNFAAGATRTINRGINRP
jgi:hypothetical protein